jgi:hypothetical protein
VEQHTAAKRNALGDDVALQALLEHLKTRGRDTRVVA